MSLNDQKVSLPLATLEERAKALKEASDKLAVLANRVNTYLKSKNLGVEAFVYVPVAGKQVWFGYAKTNGTWGLCIKQTSPTGTLQWGFAESPRALRITSIQFLPQLFCALIQETADLTSRAVAATSGAEKLLDTLE